MKELIKKVKSPFVIITIILIAVTSGGYYFFAQPEGNEMRDESNNMNPSEPAGFEENPMNLPAGDVQSGGQVNNPNIPVVTEQPIITASVGMKGFAFAPATITIKVGESVEWINDDTVNHTVTADDGSFDSGNEAPGNSYTHKFDKAGTYTYFCKWHPNMKGTIIVQQ